MQTREIDILSSKDRNAFIQFPFRLYKDCSQWVPPFISDMQLVMNKQKHPFYQHSDAEFFVTESGNEVVGRIAVLSNVNFCRHHDTKTAFFYYFDSIDDIQVASGLFEKAFDWAKKRNLNHIYGPRGFLRSNCAGMLVKGFEYLPAMGIAYNYEYYPKLMEQLGFDTETDYLSGFATRTNYQLPARVEEVAEKILKRGKFWVKTFTNKSEMQDMIPIVDKIHTEAFENNPAYYPSTKAEFDLLARSLIQIADPGLIKVIMYEKEIAGFILAFPNVSKAVQRCKGRIYLFGWIDLLKEKKRTNIIDLNGVGILPKYQGLGANMLLYVELARTLLSHDQFEQAEFVQADIRNFRSKSDSENMGVTWHKCHRTYEKHI